MKQIKVKILCNLIIVSAAMGFFPWAASSSAASQEQAIYIFSGGADGAHPEGSLIIDSAGNLYGTTSMGGSFAVGTVFELSPGPHGTWTEKVLHSLRGTDGAYPYGGLAFDTQGNLYGTAYQGGRHSQRCYYGCGSV